MRATRKAVRTTSCDEDTACGSQVKTRMLDLKLPWKKERQRQGLSPNVVRILLVKVGICGTMTVIQFIWSMSVEKALDPVEDLEKQQIRRLTSD